MAGSKSHSSAKPHDNTPAAPLPPVWRMALNLVVIGFVAAYASGLYRPGSHGDAELAHGTDAVAEEVLPMTPAQPQAFETVKGEVVLRQWSELSADDRHAIKEEAIKKFPAIKEGDEKLDWKPITEWLAREKAVIASNTREIFE